MFIKVLVEILFIETSDEYMLLSLNVKEWKLKGMEITMCINHIDKDCINQY